MTSIVFIEYSKLWVNFLNIATVTFSLLYLSLMIVSIIEKRTHNTPYIQAILTTTAVLILSRFAELLGIFPARTNALLIVAISLITMAYLKIKLHIKDRKFYVIIPAIALISAVENLVNPHVFLSIAVFLISCYLFIKLFSFLLFPGIAEKICILYAIFTFVSGYTVVTLINNYQSQIAVRNLMDAKKASSAFMFRINYFKRLLKSALLMKETRKVILNPTDKRSILYLHLLRDLYKSDIAYFVDDRGVVRVSSMPEPTGRNFSFRPYFKRAISGKPSVYISRGLITNITGLSFAFPYWHSGKIAGVMVFKYSLSSIFPINIFQGNFLLLDKSGLVIEGPERFVGTCIYCKEDLLRQILKEKILGNTAYRGQIFVPRGQNIICNKRNPKECYTAVKATIPNTEYYILKIAPLNIINIYERETLLIWIVFNLLVVIVLVEIQDWSTLMSYDPLTKFFNREALMAKLKELFERSCRSRSCVHILMIDLDRFKKVNDTFGHPVGDAVLKRVAETVKSCLRPYDVMGRYGGEEFLVAFDSTDPRAGKAVAERIRSKIEAQPVRVGKKKIQITVSIGVKTACWNAEDPNCKNMVEIIKKCIKEADKALYRAKRSGRNRVVVA